MYSFQVPVPSKRYWNESVHPDPPVPELNVAETNVPSQTEARSGILVFIAGASGCGFTVHDARLTHDVPAQPDKLVHPPLWPLIVTEA
jgi:hypothetical protein